VIAVIVMNEPRNSPFRRNTAAANCLRVHADVLIPVSGTNKSRLIASEASDFLIPFINGPRPSRHNQFSDDAEVVHSCALTEKCFFLWKQETTKRAQVPT